MMKTAVSAEVETCGRKKSGIIFNVYDFISTTDAKTL
jgi:hypothetical protein